MGGVTGRHVSVGVEHQCFIGTGFTGLDATEDTVQFGVTVDAWVLHISIAPSHVHGIEPHAAIIEARVWVLVLRDDDNGGPADGHRGVLVRGGFDTATHHQTDMHMVLHLVGGQCVVEALRQCFLTQAHIQVQCFGTFPEPLHVLVEKGNDAVVHTQSFPDPVTENESAVKD